MFKHNPFKEIRFYFIDKTFNLIDQLDQTGHSLTPELTIPLLPEDMSNKFKVTGLEISKHDYSFKLLQPTDFQLEKFRQLISKKCFVELENYTGEFLTVGNYDEPVTLSISNIDDKNFKNIDGLKLKITCESLIPPIFD